MKTFLYVVGALLVGAGVGYQYSSLQASPNPSQLVEREGCSQPFLQGVVQYELSSTDIDKLSEKLAPAVVDRMTRSGLFVAGAQSPDNVGGIAGGQVQQKVLQENNSANNIIQRETLNRATELIDKMIASRQVSQSQLEEIVQSLIDSNQPEKINSIHGRISAAVNRGELTLQEAARLPPGMDR